MHRRFGIGSVAFSAVEEGAGAIADGALGCVGACCARGAVWVDGAGWDIVDGAPAGFGVVGVCAQRGVAIARAAARVVPLKR